MGAADMSVDFFEDDPEDFFASDGLDEFYDDGSTDELTVDFAFDLDRRRLACVYTGGLWYLGVPELYLLPPHDHRSGDTMADARLAVFLATAMIHLGYALLDCEGFEVPPYLADHDGQQVRFWLGNQEPPSDELAQHLDADVDTVIRVHCSLWHAPLFGDGR
jgi:hypothetical protein